jgi:hypothetical protein
MLLAALVCRSGRLQIDLVQSDRVQANESIAAGGARENADAVRTGRRGVFMFERAVHGQFADLADKSAGCYHTAGILSSAEMRLIR